tara:strand:+ start:209 stop:598 length:390 start_codon:yes stop_codon:yes gene_type:complete
MTSIMMNRSQMIDALPYDILRECAKYICIPPIALIREIEHYGKIKDHLNEFKKYKYNDLVDIHYILLKEWYIKYAINMIDEMDGEQDGVCTLVMSYDEDEQNKIFIGFIKELLFKIDPNIIVEKTKDYI